MENRTWRDRLRPSTQRLKCFFTSLAQYSHSSSLIIKIVSSQLTEMFKFLKVSLNLIKSSSPSSFCGSEKKLIDFVARLSTA